MRVAQQLTVWAGPLPHDWQMRKFILLMGVTAVAAVAALKQTIGYVGASVLDSVAN